MAKRATVPIDLDWTKWVLLWLVLATVVALVLGSHNVPVFYRLITNGVQAQATVLELTPQMHGTVIYEYQVGGRKFERQRAPWRPNPDEIKVGQSLVIYYDPLNPALSEPGDPKPMLTNEIISVGMVILIAPTFIVFVLIQKEKEREARKKRSEAG